MEPGLTDNDFLDLMGQPWEGPISGWGTVAAAATRKALWWAVERQRNLSEGSAMHTGCEKSLAAALIAMGIAPWEEPDDTE